MLSAEWLRFFLDNWVFILVGGVSASVLMLLPKLRKSEMASNAEKEQTFFLTLLYVMVKSGKTLLQALKEAATRRYYLKHLSSIASFLVRNSETKTLSESMKKFVHPSYEFSLLIGSLGQELEGGFGVAEKLEKLIEQAISRESDRWRRYIDSVETLGEAVVAVILLLPLIYVVGGILGGFPLVYALVIAVAAAAVFYVVSSAAEPLHLVELPKYIVVTSTVLSLGLGAVLTLSFLNVPPIQLGLIVGLVSLVWGLFVHFRYIRRCVAEGEGAFLLLDSVAARLRAGYPIGKSLENVGDPRFSSYALAVARGLAVNPLNKFMALAIETVKVARIGGLGAEALSLLARLALAIHLSFTGARARMKLYTALAIGSGAAIVAVSGIVVLPFTSLPPEVSTELLKFVAVPELAPVIPLAMTVSYVLGIAVGKVEDQTIAATWRAGAGVIASLMTYLIVQTLIPMQTI